MPCMPYALGAYRSVVKRVHYRLAMPVDRSGDGNQIAAVTRILLSEFRSVLIERDPSLISRIFALVLDIQRPLSRKGFAVVCTEDRRFIWAVVVRVD